MSKKIRIGVVGAGGNTRRKHIPYLQAIEGVSIEIVCNRSEKSSQQAADEFGIPGIAGHWKDVVSDPDLDAVVIGTWPYVHAPVSIAALEAGKHVLCEARMAMNLAEAEAMLEASEAHPHLVAQVVPSPSTLQWDRFLYRILNEGVIGILLHVDGFATGGAFMDREKPLSWREQREFSGLNCMGLGIAYEAMARWIGHAETVEANGRIFVTQRKDAEGNLRDIKIPDHLDIVGNLESGASYHLLCSKVTGACPTSGEFIFYGSEGTLRFNADKNSCTLHRPDGSSDSLQPREEEREAWRVEAEFIGAICGEEEIRLTPFREGVRYMAFTQRVMEACGMA
ncbi:MAG: Gfo/Idh/MocA family oxidoreductase [Kiritimatiellia bacterium]